MKIGTPALRIAAATSIGLAAGAVLEYASLGVSLPLLLILGTAIGGFVGGLIEVVRYCRSVAQDKVKKAGFDLEHLPAGIADFVKQVVKKMRYRKRVRADVMVELTAHFQDALKNCESGEQKEQRTQQLIEEFGDPKLLAVLLRRAKKRCRPLWRTVVARTFQTVGVLIFCFIGYCVYISLGRPTISVNYVEEITRLARQVVDENQNAAPLYQKAINAYKEPPWIELETERYVPRSGGWWLKGQKIGLLRVIQDHDWIADLNENELAALQQWISANAQAVELIKQGSHKPHCWRDWQTPDNIVYQINFGQWTPVRNATRVVSWQAKLKADDGDVEGALQDILACYRIGKQLKGPRILIEQLVGMAIQAISARTSFLILSNKQVEAALLERFQDQMQDLLDQDTFIIDYQTLRLFELDFLQRCYTDDGKGSGRMIPGRFKAYWQLVNRNKVDSEVLDYGRFLAMSLAIADRREMRTEFERTYRTAEDWALKTPWQLRQEDVDLEMGLDEWSRLKQARYWPVATLMPAIARIAERSYRCKTEIQTLITTLAILRFRQIHGLYPDDLDQLLKTDLLKTLPMDPYSDKSLVYRRTEDSFMLYSVGENFTDDGGTRHGPSMNWGEDGKGDRVFWPIESYQQRQERYEKESGKSDRLRFLGERGR
jgi:hypothetical protein